MYIEIPFSVHNCVSLTLAKAALESEFNSHESEMVLLRSEIRAACAQRFAPWQQATIEIMLAISLGVRQSTSSIVHTLISAELPRHDHSIIA